MPQASVETARVPYSSTHTASMEVETKPLVLAHVFYRHRYRMLQLVLDTLAVGAAWSATFELRAVLNPWMPIALTHAQLLAAAPPLSAVIILWIVAAAYRGLYSPRGLSTASASLARAAESAIVAGAGTSSGGRSGRSSEGPSRSPEEFGGKRSRNCGRDLAARGFRGRSRQPGSGVGPSTGARRID